jgi:hypothetical protein
LPQGVHPIRFIQADVMANIESVNEQKISACACGELEACRKEFELWPRLLKGIFAILPWLGHASSGKTMLSEAMLACPGVIGRMGNIAQGTTVSDCHVAER